MRSVLRSLVEALPVSLANRAHAAKHRWHWLRRARREHELYYDQYRTREGIVQAALDWHAAHPRNPLRVLELGCSGGNNLRLLREMSRKGQIEYLGLDIQREAVEFGRRQFPDACFEVADDRALVQRRANWGRWDVFLASGVLSYLQEERVADVLRTAAQLSELVVVCDELSRFDAGSGVRDGVFLHPYALLCQKSGLQLLQRPAQLERHRYSVFTAVPQRDG